VDAARDEARRRFEALVVEVYEPLQRYLRRRVDAMTAEDVLGDVLLVLWRRLDEVPAEAELAWSYGVARRCLANSLRSTARQQRLVERLAHEPAAPDGDSGLSEALAALSDADQELLRLWAWEQLPAREIGLALGISPNAASIRLHRATKKLRKQMAARKERPGAGHLAQRQDREAGR
jgi:RNA polymerase sigma-70 factor (ECF subfamily)